MSFLPFFLTHCLSLASRGVESFTSLQNTPLQKVLLKKKRAGGAGAFPGCPVVKTLHFHFYGLGFDPWLGIYDPACHAVKKKKKVLQNIGLHTGSAPKPATLAVLCHFRLASPFPVSYLSITKQKEER